MSRKTKIEKTKICGLNLSQDLLDFLKDRFDVFEGTLGTRVDVSKVVSRNEYALLLWNGVLPSNIQEYEVFIEDMLYNGTIEYEEEKNIRERIEDKQDMYLACYRPQTIFNPIPLGSHILSSHLKEDRSRACLKVVFLSGKEQVEYATQNRYSIYDRDSFRCSNYEHISDFYRKDTVGSQVSLCDNRISERLFEPFLNDIRYDVAVYTPKIYDGDKHVEDDRFIPLLESSNGAIISFAWVSEGDITIALPQTTKKKDLLKRVFEEILYRYFSEYFPEISESAWIKNPSYFVPGQKDLLEKKDNH